MTIFSPQQLDSIVQQTLPSVPEGHTNAVVGTVDQKGAQVVAVFKLGDDNRWTASAVARHEWSGDNEVGGSIIYSW